jgi:hypothetical protein
MKIVRDNHTGLWLPPKCHPNHPDGITILWPRCHKCQDAVKYYGIEDVGSKRCDVRVKCHGKEESLRITWDSETTDWGDVANQISRLVCFRDGDPTGVRA